MAFQHGKRVGGPRKFVGGLLLALALGCSAEQSGSSQPDVTWEAFKAKSTREFEGRTIYLVEWDLALTSESELYDYYRTVVSPSTSRSASELGKTEAPLAVNQVGGVDDVWGEADAHNLTYCVSTDFGADQARAIAEMAEATASWSAFADARFVYDSSQNGSCSNANTNVTFAVRPWASGGACSFFPSGGGCVARTLVMDFNDFDTDPFWPANAPNLTTTGVFRHELGHILGFRHEHTRPESGTCFEDNDWRALTPYDSSSVMHYQWCAGVLTADLSLTDYDSSGAISLYGLSASLIHVIL